MKIIATGLVALFSGLVLLALLLVLAYGLGVLFGVFVLGLRLVAG